MSRAQPIPVKFKYCWFFKIWNFKFFKLESFQIAVFIRFALACSNLTLQFEGNLKGSIGFVEVERESRRITGLGCLRAQHSECRKQHALVWALLNPTELTLHELCTKINATSNFRAHTKMLSNSFARFARFALIVEILSRASRAN